MGRSPWVALEATTDKRERARELAQAHRQVLEGSREDGSVRQVITGVVAALRRGRGGPRRGVRAGPSLRRRDA